MLAKPCPQGKQMKTIGFVGTAKNTGKTTIRDNFCKAGGIEGKKGKGTIRRMNILPTDTTIATVEELKASILEQLDISNETKGAALDMIVIADDVSEMFEKAKEACEATKLLCGDLSDTMSSLSAISEENAASSEETSATMTQVNTTVASIEGYSNDLNGIARQLNELLAVFKVSESYTEKENNE